MSRIRLIVPCLSTSIGLTAVLLLLAPLSPKAFTVIGHSLDLSQRDARLFNNFSHLETNDNTTPEPNWPGTTGAPLAVWKALAEWGSELHGDGSGDPNQPGDVGSGGANFDVTWQGLAPSAGSASDNVVSEISGCNGGVVAFTEFGAGGWRMRFYSCWTPDDGPGAPVAGAFDLQGIVTHEYGHCLGLGHSVVAGATMYASQSGDPRSIEADDRAGVQYIYGPKAATKPHIGAINGSGTLTIVGSGFSSSGNEVWFSQATVNPTGDPVRIVGLISGSGGTVITVPTPASAGPGDVLVKNNGTGFSALSNAFPWDPNACPAPSRYCTAKVNSQGCTPAIGFIGAPSASSPAPFLITAGQVINNKSGLLIYGYFPDSTPWLGGTLCISPPIKRTLVQGSGGNPPPDDCSGSYSFDFNARIQSGVDPNLLVGQSVYAMYYSRDPASSFSVGLTDALAFTICP